MNSSETGPSLPSPSPDGPDLKAFYERYRSEFSAADLQKYTETEDGIPLQQIIAEME